MKYALVLCIIFFALSLPLFPEEISAYYELSIPLKTLYSVGFSSFTGKDLAVENEYLLHSVPLLLIEELELLKIHTFNEEQKKEYRKSLIREEILKQNKTRETYKAEIDKLVFEKITKAQMNKQKKDLEKKDEAILKKIIELKALDPGRINVPDELPIEIKKEAGGLLLDPPAFSPLQYQRNKNIDFLIYGKLEEIHGYIYFEVSGFDGILKQNVFYFKETVLPENIYKLIPEIKKKLIKIILGRDWSSIRVTLIPDDAFVFINDQFAGIGTTLADYLKPGLNTIRITHPDYFEQQLSAMLLPYEEKEFDITMDKIELGIARISSVPTGARLYMNSVYTGTTPVDVEKSYQLKRIIIKKDDYDDFFLHVGHKTKDEVKAELQQSLISPDEKQKKSRDNFYTAFGLFLLSVPFPIILGSYSKDYSRIATTYTGALHDEYALKSIYFYIAQNITLAICGRLLINVGYYLFKYRDDSDRPIG
ncbi:MAG: PEGA domain-containing protein [Spirochaetales bacterium]|nr:PEGA domain-containing protein [Spirochaetales bacterium]